jgi:unsaturated rhamnogalacturonyl hydrolase
MKFVIAALAGCLLLLQGVSGQALASKSMKKARTLSAGESVAAGADLSKDIVDTTINRLPTPATLGESEYSRALFLLGDLSVYRPTHDPKYLAYAKSRADSHISTQGEIDRPVDALDFIMPGNVAVALSQETSEERYKLAADHLAEFFKTYPRTSDCAFWHAMNNGREHQLWLDGVYMALPLASRRCEP